METVKAALKTTPKERIVEIERGEPLSYRTAYILIIIFFLASTAVLMTAGVSLGYRAFRGLKQVIHNPTLHKRIKNIEESPYF